MTHRLSTNFVQNYCNRTLIVKVIIKNVVTFFGTRCIKLSIELNLADVAARKKLKQTNASAPLIQYRLRSVKAVRKE